MEKILSGSQMKNVDKKAIEDFRIPSLFLMENAGRAVFDSIQKISAKNDSILIVCSKGNNGGDGFVAARLCLEQKLRVKVLSLYKKNEMTDDARTNYEKLESLSKIYLVDNLEEPELLSLIQHSSLLVDAILGTGIKGNLKGKERKVVELINQNFKGKIISIDLPTGVNADDATMSDICINADYTIALESPKTGNIMPPAFACNGELYIKKIGIPEELISENSEFKVNLITKESVRKLFPKRKPVSNKATYGKVFNIAGSKQLPGAAFLAAISSISCGCGYSILACPESMLGIYASKSPDIIYSAYKDENKGILRKENVDVLTNESLKADVILLGCGLGQEESTTNAIAAYLDNMTDAEQPIIIDADALNAIAKLKIKELPKNTIITPHPLEAARLLGKDKEIILNNLIESSLELSEKFNCISVLKSSRIVIADIDGTVFINKTGNSALAKAGTGDVLSGLICGFCAQNRKPCESAIIASYVHGRAAEVYSTEHNEYTLLASFLPEYADAAINELITY